MTRNNVLNLFAAIQTEFPNFNSTLSDEQMKVKVNLWLNALKDYPLKVVENVLCEQLKSSPYEPKISDLVSRLKSFNTAQKPSAIDLWNKFCDLLASEELRAVYWSIKLQAEDYEAAYEKLEELFNDLSAATRRYIGNSYNLLKFFEMDEEERGYEKARFLKCVPELQEKEELLAEMETNEAFIAMKDLFKLSGGNNSGNNDKKK